jgi:HEAT repeat protein
MTSRTLTLAGFVAALLLGPVAARGDYLGKSAAQWQLELTLARDAQARRSAAFALGKLGPQSRDAVPDLMKCLEAANEDPGVRETAAFSLGQIVRRGSSSDDLVRLLCKIVTAKTDERIARSAILALGKCAADTAQVRATLEKAIDDPSPAVRQNAAWAFGEICQRSETVPVSSLRKALGTKEEDKLVKRDAALALDKILTYQPAAGSDAEHHERLRLGKVREQARAALPELLSCAGHQYVELKKAACGTLINIVNSQDANARAILAQACGKGEDIEVRRNAALALAAIGGTGSEAAIPVLQDALRNSDPELRQKAVLAFRNLGSVAANSLPHLLKALAQDADDRVRRYAAVALGGWALDSKDVVPALVQRVVDRKENVEVRTAAAVSLQSIGQCEQAIAAIPELIGVLDNPQEPARVRERVLWALRVHQGELANHKKVFDALKKVLKEPGLSDPASGGKMLRFDAAFLFGIFKKADVPDEVFPVLQDFLQDSTIRVYTGLSTGGGRVAEGGGSKSSVAEQGGEDGRIMAIQALQEIGAKRVRGQQQVIQQLKVVRDDGTVEPKLREAAAKLLKDCGVK